MHRSVETTVRLETPEDIDTISALLLACFETPAESQLVENLRMAGQLVLSLVAEQDGRIVGHVSFSPVTTEIGPAGVGLAPLAVATGHRRQGIGSQLVQQGLDLARRRGHGWAAVLGDPAFYSRIGFRSAQACRLTDAFGGGGAFQVMELLPGGIPVGGGLVSYSPEFDRFA